MAEGYLLLHGLGNHADPLYFELGNGMLHYYRRKGGEHLGHYTLTRHRVTPQSLQGGLSPFRFIVEIKPMRSRHRSCEDDKIQSNNTTLLLSATTFSAQQAWLQAFVTWRRHNWHEPVVISGYDDDMGILERVMSSFRLQRTITTAGLSALEQTPQNEQSWQYDQRSSHTLTASY